MRRSSVFECASKTLDVVVWFSFVVVLGGL